MTIPGFFRSRSGQFMAAFAVFMLATAAAALYWRGEFRRRAAAAAAERRDTLPDRVRQLRGVRSMAADEFRTQLLQQLVFAECRFDAAITVLADLEECGMTAEIRADAVFMHGHILLYQKQLPDRAMPYFSKFLQLNTESAEQRQEAAFYLGAWHRRNGRFPESAKAFHAVLAGPEGKWKQRAAALLQEVRP